MRTLNKNGFTLLETVMAMGLSAILITASLAFFPGALNIFQSIASAENTRLEVLNPLEALGNETAQMRAVYRDTTQCYQICMADAAGDRVYYFWKSEHLYRKKETASGNAVNCSTGGTHFSGPMDLANSSFGLAKDLLTVKLAAQGSGASYNLSGVFTPMIKERLRPFYEGFECNTLTQGWTQTNGSHGGWAIVDSVQGFGRYEIAHVNTAAGADTAIIEIPVDLARFPKAVITFNYRNSGTITTSDGIYLEWWDGSAWQDAFNDVSHTALAGSVPIQSDVSDFNLSASSKFRIRSVLSNSNARWYVDNISLFAP